MSEARQDAVLAKVTALDCSGLLVTDLANVRYLTGYVGSNGVALIAPTRRLLFTDSRYIVAARRQCQGVEVVLAGRDLQERIGEAVQGLGSDVRIAIEADELTITRRDRLAAALGPDVEMVPTSGLVEELRAIKDEGEIALLREASRIADLAFEWLRGADLVGRTEKDLAWDIEGLIRREGAEGPSFPIIVAAGANGARPHAVPSADPIAASTLLVVDMGAVLGGYHSDCTRTYATGPVDGRLAEIHAVCLAAQQAAVAAVRPGISGGDLDAVARDMIRGAGYGEAFGHGLGHGVGLNIHEGPGLRPGVEQLLEPGMAITVEPGIYLDGVGGVRIEDLVIVTAQGGEVLTGTAREM